MLQLTINDKATFAIAKDGDSTLINDVPSTPDISIRDDGMISILHNGHSYTAMVEAVDKQNKTVSVRVEGRIFNVAVREPLDLLLANMGVDMSALKKAEPVKAPMPGLILKILVSPGQQVAKGDGLVILEAMKMENILKATAPATVKSIKATERTAVEKGAILIEME